MQAAGPTCPSHMFPHLPMHRIYFTRISKCKSAFGKQIEAEDSPHPSAAAIEQLWKWSELLQTRGMHRWQQPLTAITLHWEEQQAALSRCHDT